MKSAILIGLLIQVVIVVFVFAETQVYYVDITDIPINSPQKTVHQVRTIQQTSVQPQQSAPERQIRQLNQQQSQRKQQQPQRQQAQQSQRPNTQQEGNRQQQPQRQRQPQRQQTQQSQRPNTQQQRNRQQQLQKQQQPQKQQLTQQPQRLSTQQQRNPQQQTQRQQQPQRQQSTQQPQRPNTQQQRNPQQQTQKQQQPQRQQQQQKLTSQKHPQAQQPQHTQAQKPKKSATITFPGNTNRQQQPPKNQNNVFSSPSNPILAAATSSIVSLPINSANSAAFVGEGNQPIAFATATSAGLSSISSSSTNSFDGFNEQTAVFAQGSNNFGQLDGGKNFNNNRRFGPRRPQANYYRNFANIFNEIDQKAESDYSTSDEDDEMNDDFNGRSVVAPGQYPHMTALGYRTSTGETEFKCGGSLISEMFVLTAAHCCFLNGQAPHLVKIGDIKLKEFEHYLMPQRRGIARVVKHPYYNESLFYNDIGLLELTNPIEYTYFVRPIRLWARDEIPYNKLFTMGYGSTSFAQAPTNVLTELDLSIVPLEMCNRTIPTDENSPYGITESQICAKDFEKNRDTCQGDSGGPLQLNLERPRRRRLRYYLVGIISYGTFCRSQQPGVYTRVSSYIDWIASEVWPEYFNNFQ